VIIIKIINRMNRFEFLSFFALGSFLIVWLCAPPLTWSQEKEYPNKPIKAISPHEPGGYDDLAGRVIADYIAQELKVPVILENKGGASGLIGANEVLKAKPDGYTILISGDGPYSYGSTTISESSL